MAEWSIAAVLKTVDLQGSGGSNPSLSADNAGAPFFAGHFYFPGNPAKRFFFSRRDRKRKTDGDSRVPALYDAPPYRVHRQVIPLFPQTMPVPRFSRGIFIFREIRRRGFSSAGETGKEKSLSIKSRKAMLHNPIFPFDATRAAPYNFRSRALIHNRNIAKLAIGKLNYIPFEILRRTMERS